jgi:hypothetical protein
MAITNRMMSANAVPATNALAELLGGLHRARGCAGVL